MSRAHACHRLTRPQERSIFFSPLPAVFPCHQQDTRSCQLRPPSSILQRASPGYIYTFLHHGLRALQRVHLSFLVFSIIFFVARLAEAHVAARDLHLQHLPHSTMSDATTTVVPPLVTEKPAEKPAAEQDSAPDAGNSVEAPAADTKTSNPASALKEAAPASEPKEELKLKAAKGKLFPHGVALLFGLSRAPLPSVLDSANTKFSEPVKKVPESADVEMADAADTSKPTAEDTIKEKAAGPTSVTAEQAAGESTAGEATGGDKSKARRKSGGIPEHKGKKLNKKQSKARILHLDAKPGDLYLVKLKGWPSWPAIICDESMLSQTLLKTRPVTAARPDGTYREDYADGGKRAADRTFAVMYLQTNELYVAL
jgi:hypothetical protein